MKLVLIRSFAWKLWKIPKGKLHLEAFHCVSPKHPWDSVAKLKYVMMLLYNEPNLIHIDYQFAPTHRNRSWQTFFCIKGESQVLLSSISCFLFPLSLLFLFLALLNIVESEQSSYELRNRQPVFLRYVWDVLLHVVVLQALSVVTFPPLSHVWHAPIPWLQKCFIFWTNNVYMWYLS